MKGTVTSKATNDNTDTVEGSAYNFHPNKKNAEKNNDTSRILCCYSVIPNFQQIDVASARGLTDSVEAVAGLGHFRRFRRNSGQRGLRRTGSHGRDASWRHFRVEQREPKMLDLRDLDSFGIGFQTSLDVLESMCL